MADDNLTTVLKSYGQALAPGAAETLAGLWRGKIGSAPRSTIESFVANELDLKSKTGVGARYLNREYVPPKAPSGAEMSPVRVVLSRLNPELRTGALDELMTRFVGLNAMEVPKIVGRIADYIFNTREGWAYLKNPPPPGIGEVLAAKLLNAHFPELSPAGLQYMISTTNHEVIGQGEARYIFAVASILRIPQQAETLTRSGKPISNTDWRLDEAQIRRALSGPPKPPGPRGSYVR